MASELKYYIDFIEETSPNIWWFDGQKIAFKSDSSSKILDEINCDGDITVDELSRRIGIVPRAVKRLLSNMTEKGYIQRAGNDRSWYVFATQSI